MKDKELFAVLIKYHPMIIGRLIYTNIVEKRDDGLVMLENNESDNYVRSFLLAADDYTKIEEIGIKLEKSHTYNYGRLCSMSDFQFVMENFSDEILLIHLPEGYPRLSNSLKDTYIKILERNVSRIHEQYHSKGYSITSVPGIFRYFECNGYNYEDWYNEILLKHGIFAYSLIYQEIEWDFDMVEQYKDQVLWLNLISDSNLLWNEERILQFDSYFPHDELNKYYPRIANNRCGYGKVEKLSNDYIYSHKDVIDWPLFLETAAFEWNSEDMKFFYEYCMNNRCSIYNLLNNDRFIWTEENFKTLIELEPDFINACTRNRRLTNMLLSISNYQDIIKNCNTTPDFLLKLHDKGEKPHNSYSTYFTIDNIEKNAKKWNEILDDEFVYNRRTPDTNYHYHRAFTMWDYFLQNEEVSLTYDLCKYLQNLTVNIGGMYVMEDGCYLGEDHRNQKYNGFALFSSHKISSNEEIEKICNDFELLDMFIKKPNTYIIDYLIDIFFKDYSINDYLSIINQMNDWDSIYEF